MFSEKVLKSYTRKSYLEEYINGKDFKTRRDNHKLRFPNSYYCFICDCKRMLDFHHINYVSIPRENFFKDGWWMCDPRCPCKGNCHFRAHRQKTGERIKLIRSELLKRRQELRKQYLLSYIRPTTYFKSIKIYIYRKFY